MIARIIITVLKHHSVIKRIFDYFMDMASSHFSAIPSSQTIFINDLHYIF
ncbi:MAG: hypothetical protein WC519_01805 [Parcubacteria group bacterium]